MAGLSFKWGGRWGVGVVVVMVEVVVVVGGVLCV